MIPDDRQRRRPRLRPLLAGLSVAVALAATAAGPASAHQQGEKVSVTGVVTDASGKPLPDLRVVLEASRTYFSLRHFQRQEKDLRRLSAVTNARGEYTLIWPWDRYFNRYELRAAVPIRTGDGETLHDLDRVDITRRLENGGSPVVVALVVKDTSYLEALEGFLASIKTDDQRKVYREMGHPDEIKRVEYPDRLETSWWYFESGKVYRFRDGKLQEVVPFDPVKRF